jgi:predicted amidophosphoribosyltransferase
MPRLLDDLIDLLLPPVCAACGCDVQRSHPFCPACWGRLKHLPNGACGAGRAAGALEACAAEVWFEGDGARWIRRFKYAGRGLSGLDPAAEAVAAAFVRSAAGRLANALPWQPDAVVPIPAHPQRLRDRGFSAAAVLARIVAQDRRVPFRPELLRRIRHTPSQTGRGANERRRNMAGAFGAGADIPARIWLVDDVVTTSATLGEAARVLRAAGARQVAAICAARTERADLGARVEATPTNRYNPPLSAEAPAMATLKQAITLKHQPNLGEEVEEISFEAGAEFTVLKQWTDSVLVKNDAGQLFNVPKDALKD